jgi:hypothetical protein
VRPGYDENAGRLPAGDRYMSETADCNPNPPDRSELTAWTAKLEDVPDFRWERVVAIREAIRNDEYDLEVRIEAMLALVENDVGVLCRRENCCPEEYGLEPYAERDSSGRQIRS